MALFDWILPNYRKTIKPKVNVNLNILIIKNLIRTLKTVILAKSTGFPCEFMGANKKVPLPQR